MLVKSEYIKGQIIGAAMGCYTAYGVLNSSMDVIAKKAGTSKSTVYSHFGSKDGLFDAVVETVKNSSQKKVRLDYEPITSVLEQLLIHFSEQLNLLLRQDALDLFRAMIIETTRKKRQIEIDELDHEMAVRKWMKDAIDDGVLRQIDVVTAVNNLFGIINGRFFYPALLGIRNFSTDDQAVELEKSIKEFLSPLIRSD